MNGRFSVQRVDESDRISGTQPNFSARSDRQDIAILDEGRHAEPLGPEPERHTLGQNSLKQTEQGFPG